jgi:hypothetical protein
MFEALTGSQGAVSRLKRVRNLGMNFVMSGDSSLGIHDLAIPEHACFARLQAHERPGSALRVGEWVLLTRRPISMPVRVKVVRHHRKGMVVFMNPALALALECQLQLQQRVHSKAQVFLTS